MRKKIDPAVAAARGRKASLTRCVNNGERSPDDPDLADADRELAAARIAAHITKVLKEAPPLTRDQRARLAELLKPARDAITAARLAELGDVDGRKAKAAARKAARAARQTETLDGGDTDAA